MLTMATIQCCDFSGKISSMFFVIVKLKYVIFFPKQGSNIQTYVYNIFTSVICITNIINIIFIWG